MVKSKKAKHLLPPSGWGDDALSDFLQMVYENLFCTFSTTHYPVLRDLHDTFTCFLEGNANNSPPVATLLCQNAHSAYLAAVRSAASAQIREAYILMRVLLEDALYALYLGDPANREYVDLWIKRQESDENRRQVRKQFQINKLHAFLQQKNAGLADQWMELYDHCIDDGAHPNISGVTKSLAIKTDGDRVAISAHYLVGEGPQFEMCLTDLASAAIIALEITCIALPRTTALGIPDRLAQHKKGVASLVAEYRGKYGPE